MIGVTRDTTHPWSGSPGWDRLEIQAGSERQLEVMLADAAEKLWRVFARSALLAILYKPSGAGAEWCDKDEWIGCDREAARSIGVGDSVRTFFSGSITEHRVIERLEKAASGSGVVIKVRPAVPTSDGAWMDPAWFRKIL